MNTAQSKTNYRFPNKVVPFFRGLVHGEPLVEIAREGLKRNVKPYTRMVYELRVKGGENAAESFAGKKEGFKTSALEKATRLENRLPDIVELSRMATFIGGILTIYMARSSAALIFMAAGMAGIATGIIARTMNNTANKIGDMVVYESVGQLTEELRKSTPKQS